MSFFIRKGKRGSSLPPKLTDRVAGHKPRNGVSKSHAPRGRKRKATEAAPPPRKLPHGDDEITSESEEEVEAQLDAAERDSDEEETEQEARLRLAKEQISELKKKLLDKHGVAEDDDVGAALREQELIEEGKVLKRVLPDGYAERTLSTDVLLRGKVIKAPLTAMKTTPTHVYATTKSGTVVALNLETRSRVTRNIKPPPITSLAANTSTVAVATTPAILLLHPADLSTTHTFANSRNPLTLALSPETLFSTHKDRTIKLWNIPEKAYVESLFGHQDIPTSVDVLHSNRIVSAGGFDRTLRVWKIEEESQLLHNWNEDIIECVRVLSGGFFIAGSCSGNVALFSFGRKKPLHVVEQAHGVDEHKVPRWITAMGGLGDFAATGSDDGVLKVWRVVARKLTFIRDIAVPPGVVIGIDVVAQESEEVRVFVGVGTEMRNGRWAGRKANCSNVVVVT